MRPSWLAFIGDGLLWIAVFCASVWALGVLCRAANWRPVRLDAEMVGGCALVLGGLLSWLGRRRGDHQP